MKRVYLLIFALIGAMALTGCLENEPQAGTETEAAVEGSAGIGADEAKEETKKEAPRQAESKPRPAPVPAQPQSRPAPVAEKPAVCGDCGRVTSIEEMKVKGKGTGMGAAAGAIAGVIVGNQFSNEKDAARVIGGLGGAAAGHEIEKRVRGEKYYAVTVAMETGGSQTVNVASADELSVGTQVRVQGNNIILR